MISLCAIPPYAFTEDVRWWNGRLLAIVMSCKQRTISMNMVRREHQNTTQEDKWAWRYPRCNSVKNICCGSWFEDDMQVIAILCMRAYYA